MQKISSRGHDIFFYSTTCSFPGALQTKTLTKTAHSPLPRNRQLAHVGGLRRHPLSGLGRAAEVLTRRLLKRAGLDDAHVLFLFDEGPDGGGGQRDKAVVVTSSTECGIVALVSSGRAPE